MREKHVDVGGLRLHVREAGPPEGEPLLLVHGWPQHSGCWTRVAALLDDRYRCVMPDLRGFGLSDAPATGYEKERLRDDLIALLDRLGLRRVGYVGHDWGAYIGFLLALHAPERLTGLLAVSVAHPWPSRHDKLSPVRLAAFAYQIPLSTPGLGPLLMRRGLTRWVLERGAPPGTYTERELASYDSPMASAGGGRVTAAMYRTFLLRELPALAVGGIDARLTVPTRLLVGARDPIVRGADLQGYEAHADDMQVERIPGAGHFLPEQCPELVASRARMFFAPRHPNESARAAPPLAGAPSREPVGRAQRPRP